MARAGDLCVDRERYIYTHTYTHKEEEVWEEKGGEGRN
jgi:hypothetical protein